VLTSNSTLNVIELCASDSFGKRNAKRFLKDTRWIVDKINKMLKKGAVVECNYNKYVVSLWPAEVFQEYDLPLYEFDDYSRVCVCNYSFELLDYFSHKDHVERRRLAEKLLLDSYADAQKEFNLNAKQIKQLHGNKSV